VDDLGEPLRRDEFVLEHHSEQRDLRLDGEAAVEHEMRNDHWNGVARGGRQAAAASNRKGTFQSGKLCVGVPGVPMLNVLVDAEDDPWGSSNLDSMFDLHGEEGVRGLCVQRSPALRADMWLCSA